MANCNRTQSPSSTRVLVCLQLAKMLSWAKIKSSVVITKKLIKRKRWYWKIEIEFESTKKPWVYLVVLPTENKNKLPKRISSANSNISNRAHYLFNFFSLFFAKSTILEVKWATFNFFLLFIDVIFKVAVTALSLLCKII